MRIIRLNRNVGLDAARNLAVSRSTGDYVAFVNPDTLVTPNWLVEAVSLMQSDPRIGSVQCLLLSKRDPAKISGAGTGTDGKFYGYIGMPSNSLAVPREVLFPVGAAFVMRREVLDAVGGFDDSFFVGWGDADLGVRLWLAGYRVVCSPRSIAYHDANKSRSQSENRIIRYHMFKGILTFWLKNLSNRTLVYQVLPFSFFCPLMAFASNGLDGLKGALLLVSEFRALHVKRMKIQASRTIPDSRIMPMLRTRLPVHLVAWWMRLHLI